jgi:hypothetical protein
MKNHWQQLALKLASKSGYKISDTATPDEVALLLEKIRKSQGQKESDSFQQLKLGFDRSWRLAGAAIQELVGLGRFDVIIALRLDMIFEIDIGHGRMYWRHGIEKRPKRKEFLPGGLTSDYFFDAIDDLLHDLFRAQMHLNFFFQDKKEFDQIRKAVNIAAAGAKAALGGLRIDLHKVKVFDTIPPDSHYGSSEPEFRHVPEIGQRVVKEIFSQAENTSMVLDVIQFGFTTPDGKVIKSRVVRAYHREWAEQIAKWRSKT